MRLIKENKEAQNMLEINFMKDGRRVENFEIQKGVGWQFCMLDGDFKEYGQTAYFKDGEFVVKNDWIIWSKWCLHFIHNQ